MPLVAFSIEWVNRCVIHDHVILSVWNIAFSIEWVKRWVLHDHEVLSVWALDFKLPHVAFKIEWVKWFLHCFAILPEFNGLNGRFCIALLYFKIKWIKWWVLHHLAILPELDGLNGGFYIAFLHFQFLTGQTMGFTLPCCIFILNGWHLFLFCLYLLVPSVLKVLNRAIASVLNGWP